MADQSSSSAIQKELVEDIYPCTPLQEGLIALSIEQPGAYVFQTVLRLPPSLDIERFKAAWEAVADSCSVLRTRIIYNVASGSLQVVMKDKIEWQYGTDLEKYLEQDKEILIRYGDRLTRYAIIDDGSDQTIFVWTAHHAVYDGWSVNLILERVNLVYNKTPIPETTTFSAFIKYLMNVSAEESDEYWISHLAGAHHVQYPPLPSVDHQLRTNQLFHHEVRKLPIIESDITMSTRIRAAWAIIMAHYEDSEDIVFGATVNGRNAPIVGIEDIVGPTIATVPIHVRVDPKQKIQDFLTTVQDQSTAMIPFEHKGLQNIKRLNSDSHNACDFRTLLAVSPLGNEDSKQDSSSIQNIPIPSKGFHTYALVAYILFGPGSVVIKAEYDNSVLMEAQVRTIMNQFEHVLRGLNGEETDATVDSVEMFSPQDKRDVWRWNSAQHTRIEACVHQVFERQVLAQPEAPAICAWDEDLTYRQLDDLSNRLAYHLNSLGVGPEVMVPLCFEKSAWVIVAMLGVLKAGGACVALDPSHPLGRLEGIICDVEASVILAADVTVGIFEPLAQKVLIIDSSFFDNLPTTCRRSSRNTVEPGNPAFVIFTSGSTGKPKGVVLEHASVCTSVEAHGSALQIGPDSRVLQFAAYVFDVSIQDIFTTLMRGGCVCVPSDQDRVNDLAGAINSMGVNWACITPTVASLLLPSDVPGLKTLSFAGEALTKKVIDDWSELESLNNCYGPAESTIYCAWNGMVGKTGMPSNIGIGLASLLWVVNVADYNRLAPVGCVGELLLEGPLLARGYLNDPEKTAASFITDPTWSMVDGCNGGRRMYRTGDLVRYNANGTLDYLGRRDGQVKLHGQRLELGEVEYHLTADDQVGSAMVMMPSMGHYKGRLLAITTSQDSTPASDSLQQMTTNDDIILVNGDTELASMQTSTVRDNLSVQVPVYMIPSVWITVESLPLNTSGKLDRLKVAEWVKEMDEDAHRQIIDAEMEVEQVLCPTTAMDRRLQQVLGRVLNVPPDSISLNRSFLSLGGDSITAMQVVSRGRAEGIAVKVQDILQSQTISQLALIAKDSSRTVLCWVDEVDKSFDLSPVQQMYFEMAGQKPNRFNQSFFLRMTRETRAQDVALTVEAVVKQHSMLRARFHQQDDGRWCQFISTNINDSYRFRLHEVKKRDDVTAIVAASQASLNVETGPVFAADMFNVDGDGQLLFLIGHHLVMDLVSWRVILQDFEEILESGSLSADKPFPFQAWIKLQAEYAQEHLQPSKVLPFEVMPSDYAYWGMSDRTNRWEDGKSESFIIDADTTTVLLDNCQDALGTEPVDVFLATLLHAFSQTFDDRATPTVFSEGHGREPWDSNVDLSETVGWFTTMSPLHVAIESNDSIVDTVRRTKDTRRKLPDNGWPYFASRFLNEDGMKAFADHLPIEVLFNYMGRYQQLEREDGLLRQEPLPGREQVSDVGDNVQRLALFEVSVLVVHGLMRFSVVYNRHVQQQTKVKQWMSVWEQCLRQAAERLSTMEADRTLSDFPLLSLTYPGLTKLKEERLQQVGVASFAEVEDVYPCSPMQQGLLLSQTRVSGSYEVKFMFEVVLSQASAIVDLDQLLAAWQQVIDRHAALRTVFVDSVSEGGFFDQIVLKRFVGRTLKTECEGGASEALALLNKQQPIDHRDSQPPHRLTVCRTALGRVLCKLEVSHAIIDAASMAIIYHELGLAYEKKLPVGACLSYSNYIKYLQQCPLEDALNYWKKNLTDVEPCHFPLLHNGSNDVRELRHKDVDLDLPPDALHSFCQQNQVTVPNVVQTVWGLLLRAYIGSDQVCFGYLASGRDVLVDGIEEAIGPFINMLICNIDVAGMPSIGKLVQKVQAGYLAGLEHQNCSLAQIQHELSLSGTPLFNTLMSVQRISSPPSSLKVATSSLSSSISSSLSASSESSSSSQSSRSSPDSSSWPSSDGKTEPPVIVCKSLDSHDPTEYDITVNVSALDRDVKVSFSYWTSSMSEWQANNVSCTFAKIFRSLLEGGNRKLCELQPFSERDNTQVLGWNLGLPEKVNACVHQVFAKQVSERPDAPAICAWDGDFTYEELDKLSNRLSHHLIALGVGPEVLVPLCFEKSAWTVVAMMAVLKAGGACVSLAPSHPLTRLEGLIDDIDAKIILTSSGCMSRFSGLDLDVVVIDQSFLDQIPSNDVPPVTGVQPSNLAFLIYTSGSTGKPKGVALEHASICTSVKAHGAALQIGIHSRVLQFAAYVFDISIQDIFTTLMHGGCVCVPSEQDRVNDLSGAINKMEVNWACITPTVASLLRPSDIPGLKTLTLAGEAVTKKVTDIWAGLQSLNNCYGPAESTIYCAWNGSVGKSEMPSNIGRGLASLLWVVEAGNHNRLAPVGCVGELLLEGPLLARGYYNDGKKTASSFIHDPVWAQPNKSGQRRRMYKTGDLVRYNDDGTLDYLGRKDSQVKIHGQRLELGEVEYNLTTHNLVDRAVAMVPVKGLCQGRLVVVTVLRNSTSRLSSSLDFAMETSSDSDLKVVDDGKEVAVSQIPQMREYLSNRLPSYMIPLVWIIVEAIPSNTSGKLDRAKVGRWVNEMDEETHRHIVDAETEAVIEPLTTMDQRLREVIGRVLNLPAERILLNRSFLSLGGDSISAMQVVSFGRAKGLAIRVQDILQCPSISQLALVINATSLSPVSREDEINTAFNLSPIQKMYFATAGQKANHFNQSFFVRMTRKVSVRDVARATEAVIRQHSMLRSRFKRADDGEWSQMITKDVTESYCFKVHEVKELNDTAAVVMATQASLDVESGPVFAVDMFNVQDDGGQRLFLVAHHLVIDLVSWRVILQDFEEILETGTLSIEKPFPFQAWCKLQAEHAQQELKPSKVLPYDVAPPNYAYWGMADQGNNWDDGMRETFILDADITTLLLENCQKALGTEPVEVFLATLLYAFSQVFKDRSTPTVFSEGHGREPWDEDIDLSGTVGWFTTMSPLYLSGVDTALDVIDTVRRVKDTRRKLPGNGWPYFASRFLNSEGIKAFAGHLPIEVLFNYLGRYQQLERKDGLLRQEPLPIGASMSDVGADAPRLALFDVSVMVIHGVTRFNVVYSRRMQRQADVVRWMGAWKQALHEAATCLSNMKAEHTLSDFPLLPLTYVGLEKLKNEKLQQAGAKSFAEIEDIYPCSPMQQGLLLSQSKISGAYEIAFTFEVVSTRLGEHVDTKRLLLAWQHVVDRHAALRTVFIDSVAEEGTFDQAVVKRVAARTATIKCAGDDVEALTALKQQRLIGHGEAQPPHQFTVCETSSGKVFYKLEISHAIIDAASLSLIQRDLVLAYEESLPLGPGPLYSDYIKYLGERPLHLAVEFWKDSLAGLEPCHFPLLCTGEERQLRHMPVDLDLSPDALRKFCDKNRVTVPNVVQTVWGLVLRCYTGSDQVCFGYLASGRDAAVRRIEETVGPFINMLVCRMNVHGSSRTGQLVEQVQANYLAGLDHQHCSLAQIQHALNLSGRPLFNTLMSVQRVSPSLLGNLDNSFTSPAITFKTADSHDPTEYDITVNVAASDRAADISFSYWTSSMSDWQASNVASTFAKVFYSLVETGDKALSELETFSEVDKKQVEAWNSRQPQSLNGCVHAVFETQVLAQPDAQAICAWDGDFTYRKLDELSTRLAYHLMGLGVGPEVIVPLCFKKSAWTIIAMLAVLKAGGACVSLDDLHPLSRLEAIISDVDATLILASPATEALSVLLAKDVLIVDQFLMDNLPIAGSAADTAAVGNHVQPSNSAFVIYTSGSTGTPKGVVLEHRSVCTSVEAHGSVLQIGPGSRVLQFAAYVFDISIQDIFTTLMRGGCICVLSEQERMNDLAGAINRMDVNFACITPTVAGLLRPSDVPTLKTLTLAGEAVTKKVIDIWSGLASLNNCYGPAESTIYCAWNGRVGQTGIPSNIGHGLASLLWVVDVTDHNRLAPVGCIGELLLEGPLLARGYLNDTAKTTSSFVDYPAWIKDSRANQSGRMYKTGDLVRYNSDGTLDYLGRKDTQVKLHGQRLELGEVEHHLLGAKSVSNAMVMLPKMGHCQGRLVAITELWGDEAPAGSALDSTKGSTRGSEIQLLDKAQVGVMSLRTSQLREYLSNQLPTYMLPTVWILVEAIPLNTSGKLDRAKVAQWVQEMDDETYQRIADFQLEEMAGPTTAIDRRLQALLSRVLNVPAEFVALSKSFLSLGGDSITAMQVVSRGRAEGITLRVQDILQSQTISQLALVVKTNGTLSLAREDEVETVFDLSPIQQLYFGMAGDRANQFNQSFFLRLTREIRAQDMARTIEALVRQHSMLRARFSRRASDGRWGQRITKDVSESYRFRLHEIKQKGEMTAILASSQTSLDVENGPVFTADMFNVAGEGQLLFLVAHHLVIDLVSWRVVLHDFEEILESGTLSAEKPFPFQAWCKLQAEYSQQLLPGKVLPVPILPADYAYWGMTNRPNVYGDVIGDSFIINAEVTSRLLGSCHEALGTEPAEVFLATLLHAFSQTFDDRATPTVFSEGHGREPWDAEIDLSETVGWFTTMSPLHVAVESGASVVDAVRRTKDTRRKLPSNGWPYFASKYLNSEGIKAFADHMPMEMLFNYLGRYQQLERKDSLVRQEPLPDGSSAMDVACDVQRLALFEISVMVVHDVAQFRVVYNRHMHRQTDISRWMGAWEQSLLEAAQQLSNMEAERTLSDFPLLPLTYSSLTKLKYEQLDRGVTSFANVEDVYPCSPMQQGLLLSQTRNSGSYEVDFMFEVVPSKFPVVLERLLAAWQQVVNRHAALRTTFVKSVTKDGVFDQIVYKRITARTMVRQCTDDDTKILAVLKDQKPIDDKDNGALHRLTVCQTAFGRVLCKLEISHAVIDAASIGIMYREMSLAYEGKLPSSAGPLYSEYIRYIQERPIQLSLDYWKQHLHNIEPCNFPLLPEKTVEVNELRSTKVDFDLPSGALRRFCERTGVTVANVTQTVWGLVLRCYTGSDQVCFGYLASGRDAAVDGIEDAVGPFINMLVCRMDVVGSSLVGELVEHVQENYLASLDYQHCSLAQIQHGLKLSGQPLFNTLMSVQRLSKTPVLGNANADLPAISFQSIGSNDPTEYDITVNVGASDSDVSVSFSYWTSSMSEWQARNISSTFAKLFHSLIDGIDMTVDDLHSFSNHDRRQVSEWNKVPNKKIEACVHDVFMMQVLARPEAPAVCAWDEMFTYEELDGLSSRLAYYLMDLGVGPEVMVPLCFEKSAWTIVAMLAVLKAGGACVSLDPSYPFSRLKGIVCDVDAKVVLAAPVTAGILAPLVQHVLIIDKSFLASIPVSHTGPPHTAVHPANPAFVIFTSGSTGKPKGVILEHSSVCTSVEAHGSALQIGTDSRVLQFAAYVFDISIQDIFTTLMRGGCVCVPSEQERMNDLAGAINKMNVNWACITPTVASILRPSDVSGLKSLTLAGEAVTQKVTDIWEGMGNLNNCYGPAESTIYCAWNGGVGKLGRPANIGRGLSSLLWVVEVGDYDRLAPVGCVGELLVEGPLLARGYLNDPGKTAENFINDPTWASVVGESTRGRRMYRTGDLVRYNSDGTLDYLGRKDTQVKLHGQRLELGDIEHNIKVDLQSMSQVAVELVTLRNRPDGRKLAAFVCFDEHFRMSEGSAELALHMSPELQSQMMDLQTSLAKLMPPYMVPSMFIPLHYMPLNPSGKMNRHMLRGFVSEMSNEDVLLYSLANAEKRAAVTDMEKKLQGLWSLVLNLPTASVGADDSFFHLGGDSVGAMRLVAIAHEAGISLSVADIFHEPTLTAMSEVATSVVDCHIPDLEPFALMGNVESKINMMENVTALYDFS